MPYSHDPLLGKDQKWRGSTICLPAFLAMWLACCAVAGANDLPLKDRFRKEAPPRWEGYLLFQRFPQVRSTSERREVRNGQQKVVQTAVEWKRMGDNWVTQIEVTNNEGYRGEVTAENSGYFFRLVRQKKDAPWAVEGIWLKPTQESLASPIQGVIGLGMPEGYPSLPELLASRSLDLESIRSEHLNGEELVRVSLQGPIHKPGDPKGAVIRAGWLLLDPSRDWVIRHVSWDQELILPSKKVTSTKTVDIEYRDGAAGHPIPLRSTIRGSTQGFDPTPNTYETKGMFDLTERSVIPDEEFTLTAYGLPEPAGAPRTPSRWYLWAAGAGIACLVAALIVRRLRKTA